jgi:uncharacterized protein YbjT (DUF2867 family)
MKVLVYCANGLQGQAIVQQLLRSGHQVRAIVRDRARAALLAAAGAEIVTADLDSDDLGDLERAHAGIDYVVLQLVAGDDGATRKKKGERALECIRRSRSITGVVFNASVQYPKHIEELPSWVAAREIEAALRKESVPFSIVHPSFLLQNLLLPYSTHSISVHNTISYPVAAQHAFSWVGAEDIARLIDHLLKHNATGISVHAGGKRALDGAELAKCFSEGLGRSIRYQSLDLDQFRGTSIKPSDLASEGGSRRSSGLSNATPTTCRSCRSRSSSRRTFQRLSQQTSPRGSPRTRALSNRTRWHEPENNKETVDG